MAGDALELGLAGGVRFSRNMGRSVSGEALGSIRYPSPFFDIAHTYLPTSFKSMLRWCRYYFLTNPVINAVVYKMAEYPITDWVFDTDNEALKNKWEYLFHTVLQFKKFEVEAGLDYNAYGNCFVSLHFPFRKLLQCKRCLKYVAIEKTKYTFRDYRFAGECPQCHHFDDFNVRDHYIKSARDIRLIRWNPEYITVQHNEATGEDRYYYTIPPTLANDIRMGKRHIIERIPQVFLEALRQNKALLFNRDNLYHMKRPTIAQKDKGWGMPMILPVLKDAFYLQILRKAQECVAPSTLIETSTGIVSADDVQIGDSVRTHTGEFHKIEAKWYREAREDEVGVKVTPTGLRAFPSIYSPNHPVFTIRRNEESRRVDTKDQQRSSVILRNPHLYEEVVCPASQLQVGDYVLYPRTLPATEKVINVAAITNMVCTDDYVYSAVGLDTAQAFEKLSNGGYVEHDHAGRVAKRCQREDREPKRFPAKLEVTPDLGYILGWYAGDGSCGSRHIEFTLGTAGPEHYLKNLTAAVERVFGVQCTTPKSKSGSVTHVNLSDVIVRQLIKGLIPGVARTKKTPHVVMEAPDSVKLQYLKGLWEADGYVDSDRMSLTTVSRDLAYDSYRLALHFGCIATVLWNPPRESCFIGDQEVRNFGHYSVVLSRASRDRMVALWNNEPAQEVLSGKSGFFWKDYFATRISGVEEEEESTYIDFRIEKDTTFCTPGTATKNSIMIEHIVPLRILFPQSATNSSDAYSTINLTQWRDKIEQEIIRWRLDNNYIPILPVPVGQQTLGGDGRALMLSQEYRVWTEQIISGMGVPIEFYFGGMSYSGSNVSLRILENHFLDMRSQRKQMISTFIMPAIASFMGWQPVPVHSKRFKMADDLQRSAFFLQLNQAGKISDKSLLEDTDWDYRREADQISLESKTILEKQRIQAIAQAGIQGESQMVMMKYQTRGQKLMQQMAPEMAAQGMMNPGSQPMAGQPGASPEAMGEMQNEQMEMMNQSGQFPPSQIPPTMQPAEAPVDQAAQPMEQDPMAAAGSPLNAGQQGGGMDIQAIAQQVVGWLDQLPDHEKSHELMQMRSQNPQLYSLVLPLLQQRAGAEASSAAKAPPNQRPPRRGPEAVTQ